MNASIKKRIVLKLTGELFDSGTLEQVIAQIKYLRATHQFGIVVGGGNFFRGEQHGAAFGLTPSAGHHVGMLATIMNGIILKDMLTKAHIPARLFSALTCPQIAAPICQQTIRDAFEQDRIVIFSGGTGAPFFTTDTNAVIRAIQIDAQELWKATNVNGIYTADPIRDVNAKLLKNISYEQAYDEELAIMDRTAYALASKHRICIRIFNIFSDNALLNVAQNKQFASTIS